MEFCNVKKKAKVKITDSKCMKVEYPRETSKGGQIHYGVKAVDDDGTTLTIIFSAAGVLK